MARNPLQRIQSPSRSFSLLVHLAGLASFAGSFRYLSLYPNAINESFGWHWQYLTIIGLSMATACFALGALADLTLSPRFFTAKNMVAVCAAPIEVLISILYWSIQAYDKRLLVPPEMELPFLPDFGFHAMPAVMLFLDLLLLSPPWTIRAEGSMAISMAIAFLYWGWVELCFRKNGWYPYPLFELLSTTQRVALFTFSASLTAVITMALKWVYGRLNGIEELKKEALNPAKLE